MLTRREFLSQCAVAAAGMAAPALFTACTRRATRMATRRMNVLFISVDDLNPSLGCYGNVQVRTPHVDALAARGMRFTRAYAQWPSCLPSRASFLSGWYPTKTGVHDFSKKSRDGALEHVVYLPQHFKQHGYYTARQDKVFHIGVDDPASWTLSEEPWRDPETGAFKAIWTGIEVQTLGLENRVIRSGVYDVQGETGPYSVLDVNDEDLFDGRTAARAVQLLEEFKRDGRSFFLALGFRRPHLPWIAPKKYFDMYPYEAITFPPSSTPEGQNEQVRREMTAHYYAATTFVDAQIGKVINALDRLGLRDNTIVVLFGDQGYCLGERDNFYGKGNLWDRSLHVPLIISVPGMRHAGGACGRPVGLIDLYPTLVALCGLPAPASGLQGENMMALLDNPAAQWREGVVSYNGDKDRPGQLLRSVRTERHRLTVSSNGTPLELIDYETDPYERMNLVDDPAATHIKSHLQELLTALQMAG